MRDREIPHATFRALLNQVSQFLTYEVMADVELPFTNLPAITGANVKSNNNPVIVSDYIAIIAVMRAALPMAAAAHSLLPQAMLGHVGIRRKEKELARNSSGPFNFDFDENDICVYFVDLPPLKGKTCFLFDPMLATGRTAIKLLETVEEYKGDLKDVHLITLLSTESGLEEVTNKYPNTSIYTTSIEEYNPASGFIEPGMGDAGNRIFGGQ